MTIIAPVLRHHGAGKSIRRKQFRAFFRSCLVSGSTLKSSRQGVMGKQEPRRKVIPSYTRATCRRLDLPSEDPIDRDCMKRRVDSDYLVVTEPPRNRQVR